METVSNLHHAKWIGISPNAEFNLMKNTMLYFRNKFFVKDCPAQMELSISAHTRYKLWINGERVTYGPCKGDAWHHYYDVIQVDRWLKEGENVIAVEVMYFPPAICTNRITGGPLSLVSNLTSPWLIVSGICYDKENQKTVDITTGNSPWFYSIDQSITWIPYETSTFMAVGSFEEVQAIKRPGNWKTNWNCGGSWELCHIGWEADQCGWGEFSPLPLERRKIPLMYEKRMDFINEMPIKSDELEPISFSTGDMLMVNSGEKRVIELDAGELTVAYFNLKTCFGAGSKVTVTYAESYSLPAQTQYAVKGIRDNSLNYCLSGYNDVYFPSSNPEPEIFEPFWLRTFRFVRVEIETAEEPLLLFKPYFIETGYPLEIISSVQSSTHWIAPVWDISLRTLRRCMHETYMDCPYYEQIQYALDTRLQMLFTYALSTDTSMAEKAIMDFHSSMTPEGLLQSRAPSNTPNIIPVFSLYWIFMLEDYYLQTGNLELPARYRPTMDAILDWFHRKIGRYGLVEQLHYWEFIDWVEEWQDERGYLSGIPRASRQGPVTTTNLVYAAALKSAAYLFECSGRTDTAAEYRNRAYQILHAVERYCWSQTMGLYKEGPETEEYTQHAQAWAIISGLAQGDCAGNILKRSFEPAKVIQCTYMFSFFLFRALEKAEVYYQSDTLWANWQNCLALNLTTVPEDLSRQRSDCHAWSATPIYEFTRCILGVQPSQPGWKSIRIKPICFSIPNASGKVVTPNGVVEVKWVITEEDCFEIKGIAPCGIPVEVCLPDGSVYFYEQGGLFEIKGIRMRKTLWEKVRTNKIFMDE